MVTAATFLERLQRRRLRAPLAVALLLLLAGAYWPVAIDDSYISAAYAYEWLATGALRWPGEPPLEGYSNFAWVMLQAAAAALGGPLADLPRFTKLLSLLSAVALLLLLERRLPETTGGSLVLAAWLLWTPTAIWSVMALETMSFALVCTWGYAAALERRHPQAAVAALLAVMLRSDGLAWAALILVAALWRAPSDDGAARLARRGWRWHAAAWLLIGGYHVSRVAYFGAISPAPALLKARLGVFGPIQLLFEGLALAGLVATLASFRVEAGEGAAAGRWRRRLLWSAPLLLSLATLLGINGDWMGAGRMLLPGVACCVVARVRLGRWRAGALRRGLCAAAVVVTSLMQPQFLQPPTWRRWAPRWHEGLETPLPKLLAWLVVHTPAGATVQGADVGILGHLPQARIRDSRGLVSPLFLQARRSGDARTLVALYASERRPAVLVVSRFLPELLLPLVGETAPLRSPTGLDPWLRGIEHDVLGRYPHPVDLQGPVTGGLQRGWLAAHRVHLRRPPKPVSAALQEARWRALRLRFPSQPFLAEQHRRACEAFAGSSAAPPSCSPP